MFVNGFVFNLILVLVWVLFLGEVSLWSLSIGFLLGFVVLIFFYWVLGSCVYIWVVGGVLWLMVYFVVELVWVNF